MALVIEKITLQATHQYPLHVLATKYSFETHPNPDAYTLICMHAIGSHKEAWEVTVKHLFSLGRQQNLPIREVYSIENPNHGESAVLNKEILETQFKNTWAIREYTRAAHAFLTAPPDRGAKVDFLNRGRLIAVGHCLGAVCQFFMHELTPCVPFEALIAFEPGYLLRLGLPKDDEIRKRRQRWVWLRQEVWPSRKVAFEDLARNPVFREWDRAVLALYIEHALSDHPAAQYPEPFRFKGVIVSTTKEQEAATYRSPELVAEPTVACKLTAKRMPVYLIWGRVNDVLPRHLKHYWSRAGGAISSEFIEGVGHWIIQQKPAVAAQLICDQLLMLNPGRVKALL